MAVFISVVTSPFEEIFANAAADRKQDVRRPFRGLEIKKDTYASIKVLDALDRPVRFVDSSAKPDEGDDGEDAIGHSDVYSNFILQAVQEQRVEKQQVVETFGEDYIFFFGERPRVYSFNAILLNTRNFNWKSEWWHNYENILRGTKLLERNARMYIYYDDVVIEGYMLQAQATSTVDDPYKLQLQFQVFCTNYSIIGNVGGVFTTMYPGHEDPVVKKTEGVAPGVHDINNLPLEGASTGSLIGFLTAAAATLNNAEFQIQHQLERIKNGLYGRSVATGTGIGNQLYLPPIENNASNDGLYRSQERRAIYKQRDEYTTTLEETAAPALDKKEMARVEELLRLRSPAELEKAARIKLEAAGVVVDHPAAGYLLLGRGAFAGMTVLQSFGLNQVTGNLNVASGVGAIHKAVD